MKCTNYMIGDCVTFYYPPGHIPYQSLLPLLIPIRVKPQG